MLNYDKVMQVATWDQFSDLKFRPENTLHWIGVLVQKITEFEKVIKNKVVEDRKIHNFKKRNVQKC